MSFGTSLQYEIFTEGKGSLPILHDEWERLAKEKVDPLAFDFVAGNAGKGETYQSNRDSIARWKIIPRILRNVSERDLSIELFGQKYDFPIMLAPVGVQSLMHKEGELASASAAAEIGVPFIASTNSSFTMEEIASVMGDAPKWYQLYCSSDWEITMSLLKRAEENGYQAIVVTLDSPMLGWRVQDLQNEFSPFLKGIGIANFLRDPVFRSKLEKTPEEDIKAAIAHYFKVATDATLTWDKLMKIRENTKLPILLKGILDPNDAKLAIEHGVSGIVVSNHGGRQLDGAIGAMEALPHICDAVSGKIPVLIDSGFRTGADVIKALAIGAKAVLIGRPFVYGLAVAGKKGVKQVIRNILAEIDISLALSGNHSVASLDRTILYKSV